MAKPSHLEEAVRGVIEPELELPLGDLGLLQGVRTRRRRATVAVALPLPGWPSAAQLAERVRQAAEGVPGVEEAEVELVVMDDEQRGALRAVLRREMGETPGAHDHNGAPAFLAPGATTRVIGVSSGKGGVGKSSVTVNLAVALARAGKRVGLLDADVYGFSVPAMLGARRQPLILGDLVVPALAHGVRVLSMGFFVEENQPVIWRGPMLHKAIEQFLSDAYWGQPDFLLVDMPPGTGDVALSLSTVLARTEVLVVTTPQPAAQRVAQRSAYAARKLKLSVRGVIENMSWFTGDDAQRYELFGRGGGRLLADDLGVPLLGQVPLVPSIREGGDVGRPVVVADPTSEAASAFVALADSLVALGPARVYRKELTLS